jgi:DNA primase
MTITDKVKYMIYPPHATMPLYPSSVKPIKGRVILVEGIFDMVNLFDKGLFNTICCFGTNTITADKLSILKMQDIMGVDIIFDGDDPGQRAAENVKILAERVGLITRNVNLGQNIDPGSLVEQQVNNLRGTLYG